MILTEKTRIRLEVLTYSALKAWGEHAQTELAAEECIELAHACLKMNRRSIGNSSQRWAQMVEEIADVVLMIEQLQTAYGIDDQTIEEMALGKIARTENRIKEGKR